MQEIYHYFSKNCETFIKDRYYISIEIKSEGVILWK